MADKALYTLTRANGAPSLTAVGTPPDFSFAQPPTCSLVYLCPECGHDWARLQIARADRWSCHMQGCPAHPTWGHPGGTFLFPWNWHTQFHHLPESMLRREFLIWSEHFYPTREPHDALTQTHPAG